MQLYDLPMSARLREPGLGGKTHSTFGCFGSEAVTHWARDRMFRGSKLAGDMLEFCDLI